VIPSRPALRVGGGASFPRILLRRGMDCTPTLRVSTNLLDLEAAFPSLVPPCGLQREGCRRYWKPRPYPRCTQDRGGVRTRPQVGVPGVQYPRQAWLLAPGPHNHSRHDHSRPVPRPWWPLPSDFGGRVVGLRVYRKGHLKCNIPLIGLTTSAACSHTSG
jgi:hypothetical protein